MNLLSSATLSDLPTTICKIPKIDTFKNLVILEKFTYWIQNNHKTNTCIYMFPFGT